MRGRAGALCPDGWGWGAENASAATAAAARRCAPKGGCTRRVWGYSRAGGRAAAAEGVAHTLTHTFAGAVWESQTALGEVG